MHLAEVLADLIGKGDKRRLLRSWRQWKDTVSETRAEVAAGGKAEEFWREKCLRKYLAEWTEFTWDVLADKRAM